MDVQFELPSRRDVSKCVVTQETIEQGLAPDPGHPGGAEEARGRRRAARGRARNRPEPTRRGPDRAPLSATTLAASMDAAAARDARGHHPLGPGRGRAAGLRRLAGRAAPSTHPPRAAAEENFSIAIPPPNVTGALHMGHALNGTIQDALIRMRRMRAATRSGCSAPTTPGSGPRRWSRRSCVRRAPRARSSAATPSSSGSGSGARSTARRSSSSTSGSAPPATTSASASPSTRATCGPSTGSSSPCYEKGLIYRDNYIVNWDPGSRSAISDLEVVNREVTDTLYSIDYPIEGSDEVLTVATVRPETMLADTAVAVNPDRRALSATGRRALPAAAGRPAAADHRRRARRPRVRHRGAEDHPRPRPERLRDRPRPRARGGHR